MNEAKHTPGPWHLRMHPPSEWSPDEYPDAVVGSDGKHIVLSCVTLAMSREGEPLANTRLIAAAPDLLAELKAVVAQIEDYERVNNLAPNPGRKHCWDSVARAHAAIAKATVGPLRDNTAV